jgi:hypothetical protein
MVSLQANHTLRRLAGLATLLWRLDAVIDGVPQQVTEGRLQHRQHVAIHLRGLANDVEADLFTEALSDVSDQPRESLDPVREWSHPARQRLVIQAMGEIQRPAIERFQLFEPL